MPPVSVAPHALVIALGDLGRSPRMLNHARVLLGRGWRVTLVGDFDNALPPDLAGNAHVRRIKLRRGAPGRVTSLAWLACTLARGPRWHAALVQNPPGFPALWATWLGRHGRRARIVLDWHNLGASLLALKHPPESAAVRLYQRCEQLSARLVDDHWAVSRRLANTLGGRAVTVVYDRPAQAFRLAATPVADRDAWWRKVLMNTPPPPPGARWVVAPSSWGADEEHAVMLRLAARWRDRAGGAPAAPVAVIATGRGPERERFEQAARKFQEGPLVLRTAWLPPGAYPALLANADVGLCLHRSSSGLDLPMKLADMRGAALPALALRYGAVLDEAFAEGLQGWTFGDLDELDAQVRRLVNEPARAAALRAGLGRDTATWESEWTEKLGAWAGLVEAGVR